MSYTATVSLSDDLIERWREIPAMERSKLVQRLLREEFSGNNAKITKIVRNQPMPEINQMFEQWEKITGIPINGQQQANRRACSNLLKKYGSEKLIQLIQGVAKAQSEEFAPQIANFCQLQAKQDMLILWGRKQSQEQAERVIKI
jgi:hypothetical protein